MDEKVRQDWALRRKLESTFVKKQVDMREPQMIAALATAASKMSLATDKEGISDVVVQEVLDLYQKLGDQDTESLVGMGSPFIQGNIGYAVEVEDYGSARATYEREKDTYDSLYDGLVARSKSKEEEKTI